MVPIQVGHPEGSPARLACSKRDCHHSQITLCCARRCLAHVVARGSTRIRSVNGEQIIIGNGDLLKSRLRNFRRMYQRRVLFNLDVTFDTPPDALARLPVMIEQIVSAQSPVKFDRSHVSSLVRQNEWGIPCVIGKAQSR